jgi:hypothetical protein
MSRSVLGRFETYRRVRSWCGWDTPDDSAHKQICDLTGDTRGTAGRVDVGE